MKTGLSLFKSKVAKRIFFLFLLCAMLPITIFSLLSFIQVSSQLKEQSILRIQNSAKSYGLILLERFTYLDFELDIISKTYRPFLEKTVSRHPHHLIDSWVKNHIQAVSLVNSSGEITNLFGEMENLPKTLIKKAQEGSELKTNIFFEPTSKTHSRVFLTKIISGLDGTKDILIGEANTLNYGVSGMKTFSRH